MTVKDKNDRKRMKQAKTQDMQALWKCTKTKAKERYNTPANCTIILKYKAKVSIMSV